MTPSVLQAAGAVARYIAQGLWTDIRAWVKSPPYFIVALVLALVLLALRLGIDAAL